MDLLFADSWEIREKGRDHYSKYCIRVEHAKRNEVYTSQLSSCWSRRHPHAKTQAQAAKHIHQNPKLSIFPRDSPGG